VALQCACDGGVVRRAQDQREVAGRPATPRGRGRQIGGRPVMVAISCRSTAAAPRLPPPAARIARPATFMSSEIETVRRVALTGGAGAFDELAVRRRRPGVVRRRAAPTSPPGPCRSQAGSAPSPARRRCARIGMPWRERGPNSRRPGAAARAGSSSTNAGWETPMIAVRVAACGSWTMTASVSGSTHCRSRAASPGSASVPAGTRLDDPPANSSCPPADRHSHRHRRAPTR
jgi:hypothetical protein